MTQYAVHVELSLNGGNLRSDTWHVEAGGADEAKALACEAALANAELRATAVWASSEGDK